MFGLYKISGLSAMSVLSLTGSKQKKRGEERSKKRGEEGIERKRKDEDQEVTEKDLSDKKRMRTLIAR